MTKGLGVFTVQCEVLMLLTLEKSIVKISFNFTSVCREWGKKFDVEAR